MHLTITINTDNAAFENDGVGYEVARILKTLADKLEDWPGANEFSYGLRDINGNKVGVCRAE